jgi:hypothetical protein
MTTQKKDQIIQKKPFNCERLAVYSPHGSRQDKQLLQETSSGKDRIGQVERRVPREARGKPYRLGCHRRSWQGSL